MKNCEMKLNGNILTIMVDISKEFGVSGIRLYEHKRSMKPLSILINPWVKDWSKLSERK